ARNAVRALDALPKQERREEDHTGSCCAPSAKASASLTEFCGPAPSPVGPPIQPVGFSPRGCDKDARTDHIFNRRAARRSRTSPDKSMLKQPLKQILIETRHLWDRAETRPAIRKSFDKVIKCRTEALGAEIFASDTEKKLVYHTCKSRACPSCG